MQVAEDSHGVLKELGVDVLPTLRFYKSGNIVFEHKGTVHLEQDLGEGALAVRGQQIHLSPAAMPVMPNMCCHISAQSQGNHNLLAHDDATVYVRSTFSSYL